ncbi:hypothetical protein HRbin17_02351 [bacterium HR17]|uniref:Uncharacterized protein n=1 Tax=Candidatus Fervidibacter japonicus TaxID=2035412 RepID=A0A2H5XF67_9BACT|nr:hypothetical protein HRbin17_02351 [bacterium HR17]
METSDRYVAWRSEGAFLKRRLPFWAAQESRINLAQRFAKFVLDEASAQLQHSQRLVQDAFYRQDEGFGVPYHLVPLLLHFPLLPTHHLPLRLHVDLNTLTVALVYANPTREERGNLFGCFCRAR